jgi:acetylornithine deacetylase/succinyl-diaminopimelate desuccinylase-like protein
MIDVVELCQDLVRIPSVGAEHGEGAVVRYLSELLAAVPGAVLQVIAGKPGRPSLLCTVDSGRRGPVLILNGHTDTVAVGADRWTHGPYSGDVEDGCVWGRGSTDMKGGVAALVAATLELVEAGGPSAGKIVLTATADEDTEGYYGVPWLIQHGKLSGDVAIVAEAAGVSDDYENLYIASRGYAYARVDVDTGNGGHASLYSPDRPHAVAIACRLLTAIEQDFRPSPASHHLFPAGPTVIAGDRFEGGGELGYLAEHATFSVASRLLPGARPDDFLPELKRFIADQCPGVDVSVELGGFPQPWGPPLELDPDHALVQAALAAVHRAGYPSAQIAGWPAFTEASFIATLGIPVLPGLGPGQIDLAHRPDERVSIASLRASVQIYRELFDQILCEDSIIPLRDHAEPALG